MLNEDLRLKRTAIELREKLTRFLYSYSFFLNEDHQGSYLKHYLRLSPDAHLYFSENTILLKFKNICE